MREEIASDQPIVAKSQGKDINLKEIVAVILKRKWIVVLSVIVFLGAGYAYSSIPETPLYTASTRILIGADTTEMSTALKVLVREPIVIEQVIQDLGLHRSSEFQRSRIQLSSVDGSIFTVVTVIDPNPDMAVAIANHTIQVFRDKARELFGFSGIRVITPAEEIADPSPINPPSNRAIYAGLLAGLLAGVGLTFLMDSLDNKFRSARDIENELGIPALGQVSRMKKKEVQVRHRKAAESAHRRGESIVSQSV